MPAEGMPAEGMPVTPVSYTRIYLNAQFQVNKSILTTTPPFVIRLGIGSV
jgi:hypothetical protein